MRYKAIGNKNFITGTRTYFYQGARSDNPLRFVMDMTGHELAGKDYYLEREGYYTYLFNFTVSGSATCEYAGNTYVLGSGDLTLIDCANPHTFRAGKDGWEFWYLHCNGLGMPAFYERFVRDVGHVLRGFKPDVFLKQLEAIQETLSQHPEALEGTASPDHPFDDEEILTDFSERIYVLLNNIFLQIKQRQNRMPKSVAAAQEYISAHFAEKITLTQIADAAYLSVYHLSRQFHRHTGMTVGEYIAELRLNKAIELLSTSNKKIIEIALECGYSDVQMLNKLFKANFSLTPTQYRNSHRKYFSE